MTRFHNSVALAILACAPLFSQSSGYTVSSATAALQQTRVAAAPDAFHYKYWDGTPYSAAYTEWWYFNLYDQNKDLQAIFSYQVIDPENLSRQGTALVSAVAFAGNKIVNSYEQIPLSAFFPSYSSANLRIGPNTIAVLGSDTYQINGATADGRILWDLLYDGEAVPWFAADRVQVAPAAWERMSWFLQMPRAYVSGTLIVDGQSYTVESSGYHDHNWGEWNFSTVLWNWAQYSNSELSFDLGDFIGNPNGRASVDIAGRRTVFNANQYKLVHTKWAYDPENRIDYPVESVFTADNGGVHLSVKMEVHKSDPLPSVPGLVIYEQPTYFTGTVTTSENGILTRIPFQGVGFKEYTAASNSAAQ